MRVWEVSVFSVTFQPNSCGLASGRAEGLCYLASVSFQSVCWLKESPSPLCLLAWEKCWSISYSADCVSLCLFDWRKWGSRICDEQFGPSSLFCLISHTLGQRAFKETWFAVRNKYFENVGLCKERAGLVQQTVTDNVWLCWGSPLLTVCCQASLLAIGHYCIMLRKTNSSEKNALHTHFSYAFTQLDHIGYDEQDCSAIKFDAA